MSYKYNPPSGARPDVSRNDIYKIAAQSAHPDKGGSNEAMAEVNAAYERIKQARA